MKNTTFATSSDWQYVALVYDPTELTLSLSIDGQPFQTKTLNSPLNTKTMALTINGRLVSGAVSDSHLGAFEQWAVWNEPKSIGFIQDLYNGGAGKPYSEWTP